ncbi:unnamed protein product [Nesidiocoris tenuis]|uniref:Uncharacterized protein n=1 Tax=Nesidiocoris tenuis TaxID=355587 RepID=A0A6H5GD83_9HEMI|nr:unnamed protein product [Nesidiocoris tenuis]
MEVLCVIYAPLVIFEIGLLFLCVLLLTADRLKTDNGWNEKKPLISSGNVTSAPQIGDFIHLLRLNFCFE